MTRKTAVLAVSIACALSLMASDAEYDYGNVRWGMTVQDTLSATGGKVKQGTENSDTVVVISKRVFYGFDLNEEYYHRGRVLTDVWLQVSRPLMEQLRKTLTKKHKEPSVLDSDVRGNKFYQWDTQRTKINMGPLNNDLFVLCFESKVDLSSERSAIKGSTTNL